MDRRSKIRVRIERPQEHAAFVDRPARTVVTRPDHQSGPVMFFVGEELGNGASGPSLFDGKGSVDDGELPWSGLAQPL